jgi:replication-associated recombination protein RarA|uniref:ATPase AAA-type core domain-containing protein n=1 Tax=viral metagenome TaxID=1070528 RepID=A0A6C0K056_9ZZZZ
MSRNPWKGALLVCGEPGTGKSRWIREEAQATKSRIFRWNARVDRSLRDGREKLHQQVRSKEGLFVWIEGADDLTQEAQAFLRRILETASSNVTCALEVRELWKMSSPILSRCTIVSMKSDKSFRSEKNLQKANSLGLISSSTSNLVPKLEDLPALRKSACDPYKLIDNFLEINARNNSISKSTMRSIKMIGAGSSPWIQLASILARQETIIQDSP